MIYTKPPGWFQPPIRYFMFVRSLSLFIPLVPKITIPCHIRGVNTILFIQKPLYTFSLRMNPSQMLSNPVERIGGCVK